MTGRGPPTLPALSVLLSATLFAGACGSTVPVTGGPAQGGGSNAASTPNGAGGLDPTNAPRATPGGSDLSGTVPGPTDSLSDARASAEPSETSTGRVAAGAGSDLRPLQIGVPISSGPITDGGEPEFWMVRSDGTR